MNGLGSFGNTGGGEIELLVELTGLGGSGCVVLV